MRIEDPLNLIFSYLNINSKRKKFSELQQVISDSVDVLTVAEIDFLFPTAQFRLANYHTLYRLGISDKSGSIPVYIKSNITTRQLNYGNLCKSIQAAPFEINLKKNNWLAFTNFFDHYIIIGDFNLEPSNTTLRVSVL